MKKLFVFLILLAVAKLNYCQDRTFSYLGEISNSDEVKKIADSLHKPLLVVGIKVYAIGSNCITRALSGDVNDRDGDGDANDRLNDGENNERKSGGDIRDRKRKGRKSARDKDGDTNDRDEDGDVNARNADGSISQGTRCSISKKGKLLLYTREKISSKKAKIYFINKYFSNKHFKIIEL
jgi:hypothetical protein